MIELIFVIVILGILASVAIPRLAATREDAEISAAVANVRTLISDVSAYYTVKGEIPANMKWNEITNVPLTAQNTSLGVTATDGRLKVGDVEDCIAFSEEVIAAPFSSFRGTFVISRHFVPLKFPFAT